MVRLIKFRSLINPVIIFLLVAAVILIFGKPVWWPSFYHPVYYGASFLASIFLIMLPEYIFRTEDACRRESVVLLRTAIAITFLLNALGELYFYQLSEYGIQYDKIIHFFNAFSFVIVLTSFLRSLRNLSIRKALLISLGLVTLGSFLWELYEFSVDTVFKTAEFGANGKNKFGDTFFDIVSDFAGVALSYFILSSPVWSKKIINEVCHWSLLSGNKN